jgi:hypothetical protein
MDQLFNETRSDVITARTELENLMRKPANTADER